MGRGTAAVYGRAHDSITRIHAVMKDGEQVDWPIWDDPGNAQRYFAVITDCQSLADIVGVAPHRARLTEEPAGLAQGPVRHLVPAQPRRAVNARSGSGSKGLGALTQDSGTAPADAEYTCHHPASARPGDPTCGASPSQPMIANMAALRLLHRAPHHDQPRQVALHGSARRR